MGDVTAAQEVHMSVPTTETTLDERLTEAATGALELFAVHLGTQLGLYGAIADAGRLNSLELAAAAHISPRYAREWLEQQAVAGFLAVDDAARPADDRRYRLPEGHRGVLLDAEDPTHVAPFAALVAGIAQALDDVLDAYRTGAGVPYARYGAAFRRGQAAINRPAFTSDLVDSWLPAAGLGRERLSRSGARIADLGCGLGWSTVALGLAYPDAQVTGYDADGASVREAREIAASEGSRVRFVEADATAMSAEGPFDAVLLLECLHDMARPVEVLAASRRALADDGAVVVVDENVAPAFTAPGDVVDRLMYGWSVTHCLPAAMAETPSAALGTVLRPDTVRSLAAEAGFSTAREVDVDAGFFRVYRLQP
jgi:2-polyprenyl-3-methyl-5-hydroxy-6-metoxy-1,4-benzoquinol methylase